MISAWVKTRTSLVKNKPRTISIGIDPGTKNGAIAIVDDNLNIIYLAKAPYISVNTSKKVKPKLNKQTGKYETAYKQRTWTDFRVLRNIFLPFIEDNVIFTTEKVMVRPDEKEVNSFVFGHSLGVFQGQYSLLDPIAFYEPAPQTWKKEMKVAADKETSIEMAEHLFNCNLQDYLPKRARVKDDNMAEALLLAFYGLRMYFKEEV
jgi:hypothetical protein